MNKKLNWLIEVKCSICGRGLEIAAVVDETKREMVIKADPCNECHCDRCLDSES